MNEQLQSKLVEILSGIQSATKAAGDFAMEQLPDIAQSYLLYGRISLLLYVLLGVALFGVACLALRAATRHDADEWTQVIGGVGSVFSAAFGLGLIGVNLSGALLVWMAPKVWLLKELANLIK